MEVVKAVYVHVMTEAERRERDDAIRYYNDRSI